MVEIPVVLNNNLSVALQRGPLFGCFSEFRAMVAYTSVFSGTVGVFTGSESTPYSNNLQLPKQKVVQGYLPIPFFPGILLSRTPPESQGKRGSVFV